MIGAALSGQVIYGGIIDGLSIGLLALGVVLIARTSNIINFAVGAIGALAAAVMGLLCLKYHWNYWPALVVSVAAGAAASAAVEMSVITRLFRSPRVIVVIATIGVAQLARAAQLALPSFPIDAATRFPVPLSGRYRIVGLDVSGPEILVMATVPLLTLGLSVFLGRTDLGKAVRAAAANPDAARLSGINPKMISTVVWTIGGALSAVSLILLAGTSTSVVGLDRIGSGTLSRVLAAALIARMASFPVALGAGVGIGVTEALIRFSWPNATGVADAALLIVVLVATWMFSRRHDASGGEAVSFIAKVTPVPASLRNRWWVRHDARLVAAFGLVAAVVLPLVVTAPSRQLLMSRVVLYALVALSLVVLCGWSGQISLGQAALSGLGALVYAALALGRDIGIGVGSHSVTIRLGQIPPGVAIAISAAVCGVVAALLGAGALRVRGLLLAVVTFVFALAAQQFLWQRPYLSGGHSTVFVPRPLMGAVNFADQRSFYSGCLSALVVVVVTLARLRRSGVGRAMIAVRDNPTSAAAYTLSPTLVKLSSFALSGVIAGFGGALLAVLLSNITITEAFNVDDSLTVVAIAVIGGISSLAGPILGSLWVIGLPTLWPHSSVVPLLTSSIGLLVLLMYAPGGLVQVGHAARSALYRWLEARSDQPEERSRTVAIPRLRPVAENTARTGDALVGTDIEVRFGGRCAVDAVTMRVGRAEVVGLIGTNGSGKSTLMNALGGFVRCDGRVELLGTDVSSWNATRRARHGLGRTFQSAQLFGGLSVVETIAVATESRHRSSLLATALWLPGSGRVERAQRSDAEEIVSFLGLGRYADRLCSELSTGTRRIVELGALLALDAQVLCLDEPAAGVAQREAEAFGPLIHRIRDELGASVLVIEHDMPLVMALSDRIYCLEAGRVIAEGTPQDIRANPAVIRSYLGGDERAIARSGAV